MLILVTGSEGFIGRILVKELQNRGYTVRTTRQPDGSRLDVSNLENVRQMVSGVNAIIHLAAKSDIHHCERNSEQAIRTNLLSVKWLLEEGSKEGVQTFIYPSSVEVYAPSLSASDENTPVKPRNFYGLLKKWAEDLIGQYESNFRSVIFRQSNVYGQYLKMNTVTGKMWEAAVNCRPIVIHGAGLQKRNFIHVNDVVLYYIEAISKPVQGIFNLVGKESLSICDLAQYFKLATSQLLHYNVPIEFDHTHIQSQGDEANFDISKLWGHFSHRPQNNIRDSIYFWLKGVADERL